MQQQKTQGHEGHATMRGPQGQGLELIDRDGPKNGC